MGTKIRSFAPLPRDLSLEELVPDDHFYRRLEATLDLSFVRELVGPLYANGGRPSVDPVVFFKLQLIMFFEDLRSERQLMGVVSDRLSLRWYLGYDLFEPLPDHSSLTRIRERFGLLTFRRFFERIVEECVEAGLVWGEELFFDATKVEANASLESMRSRSLVEGRLEEHLVEVFPEDTLPAPDASPMYQNNKSSGRLGYQTHYVVDGGKARVILDVLVIRAEVTENLPMLELLFRICFRWHLQPRSVTGDATYGTKENIAAIEKANIRAYTALADQNRRTSLFTIDAFEYDPQEDLYSCPAGETLRRRGHDHRGGYVRYAAKASACNECLIESKCTKGPKGRWVSRSLQEEYLERVRAYRQTEPCRKALGKRAVWIEPLFGEAKEWHGLRRFSLRGLEKVDSEALMIASGQNVKRLVAFGSRAPRRVAQVAALRWPEAVRPESHGVRSHRGRGILAPEGPFSTGWHIPCTPVNKG
jgi:transposase